MQKLYIASVSDERPPTGGAGQRSTNHQNTIMLQNHTQPFSSPSHPFSPCNWYHLHVGATSSGGISSPVNTRHYLCASQASLHLPCGLSDPPPSSLLPGRAVLMVKKSTIFPPFPLIYFNHSVCDCVIYNKLKEMAFFKADAY